jgi:hypothetical protein
MGIGSITAEEVFSERVELQPRTSDPSNTEEGEGWIRSDVAPKTGQIGTLRFDTGSGTVDLPIFDTAASPDAGIETHLRVPVGGQQGFVPTTDDGGEVPAVGVWDSGTRYGGHNALKLGPDASAGIHQWPYAEGSGDTAQDAAGSADGSINGPTWISGDHKSGYALDGAGDPEYINCGQVNDLFSSNNIDNHAVAFTIKTDSGGALSQLTTSDFDVYQLKSPVDTGSSQKFGLEIQESQTGNYNSNAVETSGNINDNVKHRVSISVDGVDVSNWKLYLDGVDAKVITANEIGDYGNIDLTALSNLDFPHFANNDAGTIINYLTGVVDNYIIFDRPLTDQEHKDDYNNQPWS